MLRPFTTGTHGPEGCMSIRGGLNALHQTGVEPRLFSHIPTALPWLPSCFVTDLREQANSDFSFPLCRLRLKCDGTRAETRFRLSAKRTSPFKSTGALVQSTTGSRIVRIGGSNAGYTKFRGNVKSTGYPLHSPVSPSLPLPCVTVCHHVSTGLYYSTHDTPYC
jgi:hypothetical protein